MGAPYLLDGLDKSLQFPPVEFACREPNGLLAIGGDLTMPRLLAAYRQGIFPWFNEDQPILWWSPDPRAVLYPTRFKMSRSLRKTVKKREFTVTADSAFLDVMRLCAAPRRQQAGTWINAEMVQAYCQLHEAGFAHSLETWFEGDLVGGLYGVAVGRVFCGESMFSRRDNASKIAFAYLVQELLARGFDVIDCQMDSAHLRSLGAELIPRTRFIEHLRHSCDQVQNQGKWTLQSG